MKDSVSDLVGQHLKIWRCLFREKIFREVTSEFKQYMALQAIMYKPVQTDVYNASEITKQTWYRKTVQ